MAEKDGSSWDEIVDRLRSSVDDLRSAAGRPAEGSAEESAAANRLKADVSRLEQSAARLKSTLTEGINAQKAGVEESFDRDQAEKSTTQIKESVNEILNLSKSLAVEVKDAAQSSFASAEPELKAAIRTLEDVAASAGAWVKTVIDPNKSDR